jgi:hypothetical protein
MEADIMLEGVLSESVVVRIGPLLRSETTAKVYRVVPTELTPDIIEFFSCFHPAELPHLSEVEEYGAVLGTCVISESERTHRSTRTGAPVGT